MKSIDKELAIQCIDALSKTDTPFIDVEPQSLGNFRVHLFNESLKQSVQLQTKKMRDNPAMVRVRLANR